MSSPAFKTKAGRTVYDGGGVLPDVEIEETKISKHYRCCFKKNDAIFNLLYTMVLLKP